MIIKNLLLTVIAVLVFFTDTFSQTCWQQVSSITDPYLRIVKHSNNHFFVAAGNATGSGSPSTNSIYESNDLENWNPIPVTLASPAGMAFNVDNIGNLFLSTQHAGVYTSSDTATSWSYANVGSGFGCMALDFEKDSLNNLYVGIGGYLRGLNVSTDSGASWINKIGGKDFTDIEVINSINQVYASNTNNEIFFSSDNGNNWTQIIGQPFSSNTIMIKHINSKIYVFSNNGNVYKSSNNGISWTLYSTIPISGTATPYCNDAAFTNTNIWWVGIYQNGVWRSGDNGLTWSQKDSCLTGDFHYLFKNDTALIITTSTGIFKFQECNLSITLNPSNISVTITDDAQFTITSSDPLANYQWQTDLGVGFQNLNSVSQYSGTTNDTLTISYTTMNNNNQPFRCIIKSGSCSDTSNVAVLTINNNVSINDIKNSSIKIYPNPTNNIINIEGLNKNENNTIQIFDVQGKLVITKTITEKGTIDLSELNKGVYVIKIGEVAQRIVKM